VLASGSVSLYQVGKSIVHAGELGSLAYLPLFVFLGSIQDDLPNVLREGLVGIRCIRQLAANPCFCDFLVSVDSVIYIPDPFGQHLLGFLDLLYSLIGPIDRIAAQLGELPQVILGLPLLPCHGSDPYGQVGHLYCLFASGGSVSDLEQVPGCIEPEHIEIGGGRHFSRCLGDRRYRSSSHRN